MTQENEKIACAYTRRRNRLRTQQSLSRSRHRRLGAGGTAVGPAHHRHCGRRRRNRGRQPRFNRGTPACRLRRSLRSGALRERCRRLRSPLPRSRKPPSFLPPATSRFTRVAAGVAHRLGGFIDTHITALGGTDTFEASRWFYRQRIEAVVSRDVRPWFLLLDAGTHAAFAGQPGAAQVEQVAVQLPALRTTVSGFRAPAQDAQTIRPDAKMLFVAGAGWTKKQPDGQSPRQPKRAS